MDPFHHGGRRVAFFGGSFDPPHLGHLAVARAARVALKLDTVLFAPVGAQPLKPGGSSASFADRLEMTRLAIAEEPGFSLSLADAPKPAGVPNYTLETLLKLRAVLPPDGELFCLMGADSYFNLRSWHGAAKIPFAASLIVASRPDQRPDQRIAGLIAALPAGLTMESALGEDKTEGGIEICSYFLLNSAGDRAPFYLLPGLNVEISASEIREQIHSAPESRTGGHELLPNAVSTYIRLHGLYS
ncbi:MAG: nicotinate (nicotinamide) nucleotide adenylyltransferase [Terracidiphilus sp.]|nr:nicotinate (nicotinamide) nucleotide adenylyltransferase [Terracidiphilus sp.]